MNARRLICPDRRKSEVESYDPGPVPSDGLLVENLYTAVSIGTEVYNWIHGSEPGRQSMFPRVTGYCSVGRALEVGSDVEGIQTGDLVAGQGNHASHAVLRTSYNRVPGAVDPRQAAFTVMSAIALHGIRVAQVQLGESVVVFGLGLVGQIAAKLARLSGGLPVIGIDLDAFRIEKAIQNSCDIALHPEKVDLIEEIGSRCAEDGANIVLESTGKPVVYPTAAALACRGGRVVALGSPRGTVDMDFLTNVHLREVSILGAHQPKTPDDDHIYYRFYKKRERDLVLHLMAVGRLDLDDLITHTHVPEACQEVYDELAETPVDTLGVLFDWTR